MYAPKEELERLSSQCRKVIEALDDLQWIDPDTGSVIEHERAPWAQKILEGRPFPHHGVRIWLREFDAYLNQVGYEDYLRQIFLAPAESEDFPALNSSMACYALREQVRELPPVSFDAEEKKQLENAQRLIERSSSKKTFRELTDEYIESRFGGNAAAARKAAFINRKTFSKFMKDPDKGGSKSPSKESVVQLAFAFGLTFQEAEEYLKSAGHAFKLANGEVDRVFAVCFLDGLYDFDYVNFLLRKNGFPELVDPDDPKYDAD